ncbi:glucose/sorbosone dehydrogenase [Nitzschia inconspicua]|uniref:Glucose/sorbosone dehydrogenase n=1 Tax=Nitzschia inconspicua TaxID=303405 RepID=A0A9K3M1I1_9STRA|nr:glucose/sorbosone dehydrogenase [Nitzschia inconspicua]
MPRSTTIIGRSLHFLFLFAALLLESISGRYTTKSVSSLRRNTVATQDIVLAAEDATLFESSLQSNHVGFTGNGFIDYGEVGSYAIWSVDIPVSGSYQLILRYASANNRGPMSVLFNGTKVGEFLIATTTSWTNWISETITVSLSAGKDKELKLFADVIRGPNVDMVTLKQLDTNSGPSPSFKVVLEPNQSLVRNQFVASDSGAYETGLNSGGDLVVRDKPSSTVLWSLAAAIKENISGDRMYMQDDGNLVIRDSNQRAVWDSKTYNNLGAQFSINNKGGIAVISRNQQEVWTGGPENRRAPIGGSSTPTPVPVPTPYISRNPTSQPTQPPWRPQPSGNFPYTTVLQGNQNFGRGTFVESPNRKYRVGLNSRGNLIMMEGTSEVWRLKDTQRRDISSIERAFMQSDGNLVLREMSGRSRWNSETSNNFGSEFRIDDGGQLSVVYRGTVIWMDGIPRQIYRGPSSPDLQFPVRGMFYYAWYPETWTIGGVKVFYRPNLGALPQGHYRSDDPLVVQEHVKALDYAFTDLGIISWWGVSNRLDRARITQLMDETVRQRSPIKWTVYYENEMENNFTVDEIVNDLNYLKHWFAWHPTWAHKDGKPVIFVWNENSCDVANRWKEAGRRANWYVVLKLFPQFESCPNQPDSWHQYGVANDYLEHPPYSFCIAPGFWKANDPAPRNPRIGRIRFCEQVAKMNKSGLDWQLVVSFNEWGEGTAVESAVEWSSASGYGDYLDCLHDPIRFG